MAEDNAGNDAKGLLAGAVDIGGAGPDDWKVVLGEEGFEMDVAGGSRCCVGRRGVEWGGFVDYSVSGAVDFGSGYVNVFFERGNLAQGFVEGDVADEIGIVVVEWVLPAFGDHPERGEVDDVWDFVF